MPAGDREYFLDNLLVRIHLIIVMIRWTGLAPWEGYGLGLPAAPASTSPYFACLEFRVQDSRFKNNYFA